MKDLSVGHVGGNILKFTAPMLAGNLFQQTYIIVDSIIIGHYVGKEALGAVGASFPVIFALISFVVGIASGGTIIIAQYFGAKDYARVRRSINTIFIFISIASVIISVIGILASSAIFKLMGLPEELMSDAKTYLITFLTGTILLFGFNGTCAILRGLGDSVTPLIFLIIATITNTLLAIFFVRILNLGVMGAALATVAANGGAFLTAVIYLNKNHKLVRINLRKPVFDWHIFRMSVNIGVPSGLQQTFVSVGMFAIFSIVNKFGTDVIAAYSVANRIDNIAILPAMNFGQALSTFTGQNIGAGKINRVREGLRSTLLMTSLASFVLSLIIIIFRRQLMGLFTSDLAVISYGSEYLMIVAASYLIFSTMFAINGILRGAGDTLIPMFISLLSLWIIRIPVAALLSGQYTQWLASIKFLNILHNINLGESGIWWSVPVGWTFGLILAWFYYRSGRWKRKKVIDLRESLVNLEEVI